MKRNIFIGGAIAALMLPSVMSCSSDYLDEDLRTGVSAETVKTTEEGAKAAVTGLVRQMQRQYAGLKNGNLNVSGEAYLATIYGEGLGPDANVGEITNYASSACSPSNLRTLNGWWAAWMYNYSYSIIGSANSILGNLPAENLDDNQNWLKACALTMRAHAYWRLMQVYAPRWADSKNGDEYCLVLRIKANEPNEHPLNTCNDVYDQMYADLKEAIECYGHTSYKRAENLFYPDVTVAKGVFARLAMLKNDYATAQQMAHEARQSYSIMTPDEYLGGFSTVNREWMWAPAMDPLGIYYWGFGSHFTCNGHYTNSWGYSSSMDYALYRELKLTDVRSKLYFGPMLVDLAPEMAAKYKITKDDFFSSEVTSQTKLGVSITSTGTPDGKNLAMWNFIKEYGGVFSKMRPPMGEKIYSTNKKGFNMGLQFKFQGLDDGYTSCWPPYMRASEMLLTEAEAAYMNGDVATAKSCLEELMAQRDETYTVTATGADLLDEIKLQRRIELWGEGWTWFDLKRWNTTMERKAWDPTDLANCGGWPKTLAWEFTPDFQYGWRAAIPTGEFTYNKEADQSLLGL